MTSESSWSLSQGLATGSSVLSSTEPSFWTVTLPVNGRPSSWPLISAENPGKSRHCSALRDRFLEERDRLGVRLAALKRPVEGQRGELANLIVFLAAERAGLLERLADIDRVPAGCGGGPARPCRPDRP